MVVLEQGKYFDTTLMKTFTDVNQMRLLHVFMTFNILGIFRMNAKDQLVEDLSYKAQLPKMWSEYGRIACPRLCFLFPERCIRYELPVNKKKEIAEKLEQGWEIQIFNNLKHIRVVDTSL